MKFQHEVLIDCSAITPEACSDACLAKLGHARALKLKADAKNDTVHGGVTIIHNLPPLPHVILVEIYEAERGRHRKPATMPSAGALKAALDTL